LIRALSKDQRGLAALETAIIFIAFVSLAALFAFSVIETGVLAARESEESVLHGIDATTGTLLRRGAVIGVTNEDITSVASVRFQLANALKGSDGVNLASEKTVVTYIDEGQMVRLSSDEWDATWLTGYGSLVNPGERVEIRVDLSGLDPPLGPSTEFAIEISPENGRLMVVKKTTPYELVEIFDIP